MHVTTRLATAAVSIGAIAIAMTAPAGAHVGPDKSEVPAGAYTDVALTVPHGCGTSPTVALDIQIPESIPNVTPAIVAGWDVSIETESLDEPIEGSHGEQITERESVVTYTAQPGHELPDGFRQSFTIGFRAPDTPGEHLFFKTIQRCTEGEEAWITEYTGEGDEPAAPAPAVLITDASAHDGDDSAVDGAAGEAASHDEEVAAPAAGDSGGDSGSATAIAVAGLVAGLLGLGTGGAALARSRNSG